MELTFGDIYREISGYPKRNYSMPPHCCIAMRGLMLYGNIVIKEQTKNDLLHERTENSCVGSSILPGATTN